MKKSVLTFMLLFSFVFLDNICAQESVLSDSLALLRKDLRSLQQKYDQELLKLDSLMIQLETKITTREQEDDLQKLLEEANQLAVKEKEEEMDHSKKFHTGVRQ